MECWRSSRKWLRGNSIGVGVGGCDWVAKDPVFFVGHDHTHSTPYFYSILPIFTQKKNWIITNWWWCHRIPNFFHDVTCWFVFTWYLTTMVVLLLSPECGGGGVHNISYTTSFLWGGREYTMPTIPRRTIFTYGYIKQMLISHHDGASLVSQLCKRGEGVDNIQQTPTSHSGTHRRITNKQQQKTTPRRTTYSRLPLQEKGVVLTDWITL